MGILMSNQESCSFLTDFIKENYNSAYDSIAKRYVRIKSMYIDPQTNKLVIKASRICDGSTSNYSIFELQNYKHYL